MKIIYFFFEEMKMVYINIGGEKFSVQDVPKNSPRKRECLTKYYKIDQSKPKQSIRVRPPSLVDQEEEKSFI